MRIARLHVGAASPRLQNNASFGTRTARTVGHFCVTTRTAIVAGANNWRQLGQTELRCLTPYRLSSVQRGQRVALERDSWSAHWMEACEEHMKAKDEDDPAEQEDADEDWQPDASCCQVARQS